MSSWFWVSLLLLYIFLGWGRQTSAQTWISSVYHVFKEKSQSCDWWWWCWWVIQCVVGKKMDGGFSCGLFYGTLSRCHLMKSKSELLIFLALRFYFLISLLRVDFVLVLRKIWTSLIFKGTQQAMCTVFSWQYFSGMNPGSATWRGTLGLTTSPYTL